VTPFILYLTRFDSAASANQNPGAVAAQQKSADDAANTNKQ
jgi:hypothetical protein